MSGLSKKNIGIISALVIVAGGSVGYGLYSADEDVKGIENREIQNTKTLNEDTSCTKLFDKSKILAIDQNETLTEANQILKNQNFDFSFEPTKKLKAKLDVLLNNSNEVFTGINSLKPGFVPFSDKPEVCVSKLKSLVEDSEKELKESKSLLKLIKDASNNSDMVVSFSGCKDSECSVVKEIAFDATLIEKDPEQSSQLSKVDMYSIYLFTDLAKNLTKLQTQNGEMSKSCDVAAKNYLDNYQSYIDARTRFENDLSKNVDNKTNNYIQFSKAESVYNLLTAKQAEIAKDILSKGVSKEYENHCQVTFSSLDKIQNIDTKIFTDSSNSLEEEVKAIKAACKDSDNCDTLVMSGVIQKQSGSYTKEQVDEITESINKIENSFAPPRHVEVKETKELSK